MIRVLERRWRFTYPQVNIETARPAFDRQVRAFGQQSTLDLSQLRVGLVGCEGTGSAAFKFYNESPVKRMTNILVSD